MREFIPPARPLIGDDERAAVDRVMRSGMLAQGPEVKAFEEEFSEHFGFQRACVAVNSGTSGLHLGLLAAGLLPGDEVIVPSFTFAATANAVVLAGGTPVFADIEPESFCLSPRSVEKAVTNRTVGIMPVHLYGHPANMVELTATAIRLGIQVFEDAAQAHGASLNDRPVGTFGSFGMFSLYPTKNMTSGEGGMVTVANPEIERLIRLYRNQGMQRQYHNEVVGLNNRMTDIHAAIGRVQLHKIDEWTKKRQENARYMDTHLEQVTTPSVAAGAVHVYHQYTIRIQDDRNGFAHALRSEFNIGTGIFYSTPVHLLAPFNADTSLPNTTNAASECLSLPIYPALQPSELERIVVAVNKIARAGA
ncbi:DegT/DnrJ/EryC1/StrS family aminotransferase [Nakamurella sp. GG22]